MNASVGFPERMVVGLVDLDAYLYHIARYIFAVSYAEHSFVLDVGCGMGYGSYHLCANTSGRVVGVDIDADAINHAHKNYETKGLAFVVADGTCLPFKECSVNVVVAFETIEHIDIPSELLSECHRVLNLGGFLLSSTPNKKRFSLMGQNLRNPFHKTEFTFAEFESIIKRANFSIVLSCTQDRIQPRRGTHEADVLGYRYSKYVPNPLKFMFRFFREFTLNRTSLRNLLLFYLGEPKEIAIGFSSSSLPEKHRVVDIRRRDSPDLYRVFIVVAKKGEIEKGSLDVPM